MSGGRTGEGQLANGELAGTLFRQHYRALVRYLSRRLDGNQMMAEDVAQEAMVRIASAPRDYECNATKGLLYRVAGNLLIDHFRSESSRRTAIASLTILDAEQAQPSPQKDVIAREELRIVREAILQLPERCREVYLLHRFEEMTYAQIATHCGISTSMVEKHMHKALLRLADAVDRRKTGS